MRRTHLPRTRISETMSQRDSVPHLCRTVAVQGPRAPDRSAPGAMDVLPLPYRVAAAVASTHILTPHRLHRVRAALVRAEGATYRRCRRDRRVREPNAFLSHTLWLCTTGPHRPRHRRPRPGGTSGVASGGGGGSEGCGSDAAATAGCAPSLVVTGSASTQSERTVAKESEAQASGRC